MEPYLIRQGDYVAKLAHRLGFDADDVWQDGSNADIRGLRGDPNILAPTDLLYIPDESLRRRPTYALQMGTTNTFVTDIPAAPICLHFLDAKPIKHSPSPSCRTWTA